ncbi:PAS domain S-box protein [Clostridium algoriphilum]|uniref:PAS domain-containing sensor histidine kinase n=1 Tax=Clostridium algoriphilum TaxID=198347 RepID=UPI001CF1F100|nr:PAS domain-containing sensor histidine kinase [Clostridium algoriphilum]MCB2296035.1 PAS domain S-box protein [Clostridium algoriphilum]
MNEKLGVIVCKDFAEEVEVIIKKNNMKNVEIAAFLPECIYGEIGRNEQLEAIKRLQETCNKIIIVCGTYCSSLNKILIDSEKCKIHRLEYCFELFTNRDIIAHFISEKAYLVTPGWLRNWEKNIRILGLDNEHAKIVFREASAKIILLDTGVFEDSLKNLEEFAEYVNLPYDCISVGLDFFSMFIQKNLMECRLGCERRKSTLLLANTTRQSVDSTSVKQQLSYILNSIHEGVFIINSKYETMFVNKAVKRLLNLNDFKDIIGKNAFDIVPNEYRQIVLERFKNILDNKISAPLIEEKFVTYDGCIIDIEIYSGAIRYEGNWCILSVVRNISERKNSDNLKLKIAEQNKLLDEAREYDKLKNEFFCNLSHELRTPINVMLSALQLLNLNEKNKSNIENEVKVKKYYNIMKQNSYRLLRLVNNLIDITKIDARYFNLRLKNENIVAIIEDITMSVTNYAKHKELELIFDTDIEEKTIVCDADKIERIILNLLSNAIKFTPPGGNIFVNITDKDSGILVSVKDTGVGIPADMKLSIFERFVQVDKSLSRNREGSGIGLSLVKSLVEMQGGTIRVESQYGSGSDFIIELPEKGLPESGTIISDANIARGSNIERIKIEFSDIYD